MPLPLSDTRLAVALFVEVVPSDLEAWGLRFGDLGKQGIGRSFAQYLVPRLALQVVTNRMG
jgi:hypothetical protein